MGHTRRFSMWATRTGRWCATIGDLDRRGLSLRAKCSLQDLEMAADIDVIVRARDRTWSPWGKTANAAAALHGPIVFWRLLAGAGEYLGI